MERGVQGTGVGNELSRVVDALPGLVWTALPDGQIDFLNERWREYTGVSVGEACGRGWQAAIHADDLPKLLERWRFILDSGEPSELEARLWRNDGVSRWFLFRFCPLADPSGQILKWCGIASDIDDRKRTEEGLRIRSGDFRSIADSIPALIALMTPAGAVEIVNRHALEYYGVTLDELKSWAVNDTVHPDDLPIVVAAWMQSIGTGEPYDIEHRIRRADGIYRWFRVSGLPARDSEGHIVRWCVLQTDIDDRKRAEEELRRGEARKTAILDSALDCIVTIDHEGCITEFNPAAERTFGYPRDQVIGKHLADTIIPPSLREQHRRGFTRYLATGEERVLGKRIELTALRADGSEFPVELAITRIRADGPPSFTGYLRDITERKLAEQELQRSEAFLAEGQRLGRTGSFSWRLDTGEIRWSEEVYRIFEVDSDLPVTLDLIGSRVHPEDLPLMADMVERAQAGKDFEYAHRLLLPDKRVKYLHLTAHGTRTSAGQLEFIGAVQDVTERRLSEEALGKLRSELAHMTRITSLGALTASIAHEVNQPLSGIVTNASTCLRMLAADPPNVDGARETARRTIRDGNRASEVITRLRALFGKKDAPTELVDLNEATREVVALSLSELQGNRVVLRIELVDDLPPVIGDRVQLQQVILNLVRNASDAMSGVEDRPRQLLIGTERDGEDSVRMAVQDTGIGIDPLNVERLFDAFYSTKSAGMGMGLSVCRSIIESHHGRLWAAANDGPGATFSFSIPRAPEGATGASDPGVIQASALTDTQNFMRNP
jgi:PAS domain S-box-containing protein